VVRERSQPPPATTVARPSGLALGEARLAVQRKTAGDFAHSADYSWLQGVLEKKQPGELRLRYSEQPLNYPWEGSVLLENDPRLSQFQDGDIIAVDGEFAHETQGAAARYHAHAVWLVRPVESTHSPR
jgi:hypothetical protein